MSLESKARRGIEIYNAIHLNNDTTNVHYYFASTWWVPCEDAQKEIFTLEEARRQDQEDDDLDHIKINVLEARLEQAKEICNEFDRYLGIWKPWEWYKKLLAVLEGKKEASS